METSGEIVCAKVPLAAVWKGSADQFSRLEWLVNTTNFVTMHAYALANYVFTAELEANKAFDPGVWLSQTFFYEAWTSLTTMEKRDAKEAKAARDLVNKHVGAYKAAAGLSEPIEFPCAGQLANYEAKKMAAAYKAHISLRFGDTLRCAANILLDVKQATADLSAAMEATGSNKQQIKQACYEQVRKPAGLLKAALATRIPDLSSFSDDQRAAVKPLVRAVHASYALEYEFDLDSIYYDVRAEPVKHFLAFCRLSSLIAKSGNKRVFPQPMRTSFVPGHIHIDKKILAQHLVTNIGKKSNQMPEVTMERWRQLLDLDHKIFKDQGDRRFCGAIQTDLVSLVIIKKTEAAEKRYKGRQKTKAPEIPKVKRKRGQQKMDKKSEDKKDKKPRKSKKQRKRDKKQNKNDVQRIDQIPKIELRATRGRCVLIDPGWRDLFYAMHENSTARDPWLYRYTSSQKNKEERTRRFSKIREKAKDEYKGGNIHEAEQIMSMVSYKTDDPEEFLHYVRVRSKLWPVLSAFYTSCMTTHETSNHQLHRIRRELLDGTRSKSDIPARRINTYTAREPRNYPLHRKLRMSAYFNKKQSDDRLVRNLRGKFGKNAVYVVGNWSAPMQRFHEPVRGKGMRQMMRKRGLTVYLIDEYKTSSYCPACRTGELKSCDVRHTNPRPHRRARMPTVKCHGLLKCNNETCLEPLVVDGRSVPRRRLWNRDLAAVCNFRHILFSLRARGAIPTRFQRPSVAAAVAAMAAASAATATVKAAASTAAVTRSRALATVTATRTRAPAKRRRMDCPAAT